MKVCTDACLFGTWITLAECQRSADKQILDIGTGTGLLSLIVAQKNSDAYIDAVELDEAAAKQAAFNFKASPWKERLNIIHGDVRQLILPHKYDLIISNPPFFDNHLKSLDEKRNIALHSDVLSFEILLFVIDQSLKADGNFAVLLPNHRTCYFESLAQAKQFYLKEKVLVKQTPKHNFFRSMLFFSRKNTVTVEKEITIEIQEGKYSNEVVDLLKDYYLYL